MIVEFSTQDQDSGHEHTIYRNPANEYGGDAMTLVLTPSDNIAQAGDNRHITTTNTRL